MFSESISSIQLIEWTLLSPLHFQQVTFCRCLQISTAELKHQTFQHQYHNYHEELHTTRYALCFRAAFLYSCLQYGRTWKIPGKLSYICLFPEKTKSYYLIFFHFSAHKSPIEVPSMASPSPFFMLAYFIFTSRHHTLPVLPVSTLLSSQ